MVDFVISIAANVAEYLVAPVGRQLGYLFHYNSNMAELRNQVEKLDDARGRLQRSVDAAERQGDEIEDDVQKWLTRANSISREAQNFIEDEKKAKKSCFKGLCPNLISRHQLSRQAKKKAHDVEKSRGEGNFPTVSHRPPLPGAGSAPLKDYEAFESRASTLDKVMAALRDDKIKRIGVWGLGGVGKTTLVKQVAKLAEDDKLFDKVVMVAVSREQNLENIQAEIADSLDLNIEEKSKSGRANRLIEILKKKKLLIILDDIWAKLDLEAVGIPCGDDHVGCKIVVTSRRIDVLSQDMGTQPNFEIRILSNDEAWRLFQKTTGGIPEFDVQSVARKVAENCGGLPIALVTVAKALKNKSLPFWDDALRQLTSPVKTDITGMDENVYKSLELSYDSLESEDAKLLFLLCGLMGYGDISLDDLFKCSLGLGFFQSIKTLDDSTNRLQVLVDRLKGSSLLLDIDRKEYVKMHDVVRDVARQLASKDPRWFVIHESTRYIPLSLSHEGTLDLGEILDRPKIEFFRLVNEGRPLKIPDPLFNGMGKLKVLHLFRMEFSSLPLSFQSLANLRTLCLHRCTLRDVAGIGELKKLEVLSFWGSNIKQLPREIAQLTCLRWLDLRNCYQLQVIPPNILSNLSQLEHLCMKPPTFTQSEDEEINQERNACLAELKHLSRLTTLNIALQDLKLLPKDMVFEKLTRFKIFIGGLWDLASPCETKRALKLYKAGGTLHLVDGIGKLLKKTEELSLRELSGTKSIFHESYKEDFLQLKHLDVHRSPEIQYIVDSKYPRVQEHVLFPLLESLLLRDLINLEKVCHGPIPRGSFGNLKTLKVSQCHGLKIFLSLTMATGFLHLQKIQIEDCDVMQQIIAYERESEIIEDGHGGTTLQLFPKLRSLRLYKLPELMNFSSKVETTSSTSLARNARSEGNCDNRMSFFSNQVSFTNLEKLILRDLPKLREIWHHQHPPESFYNLQILEVHNCPSLLNLIPSHLIQRFDNLKKMDVNNCEVLKHVFDLQGLDENIRILPRLESLRLNSLPKLRGVVCNEDDDKNDSVRCRFSSSTAFHNLKFLSITNCGNKVEDEGHINTPMEDVVLFDGKVSFTNLEKLILCDLPKLREIWHHQHPPESFYNLQILEVYNCPSLLNLIPSHLIQRFDNLKKMDVDKCEVLKHVFDLQGLDENIRILPRLESLRLNSLPKLRGVVCNEDDDKNDSVRCRFSSSTAFHNLKFLSITNCGNKVEDEGHINTPMEDVVLFDGKVSFTNLEKLILHDLPKLREIWHHQHPPESFYNLQILEVDNCPSLLNLIPSHLIQRFDNLKKMDVNNCEVLKHVFDLQGLDENIRILPRLESLRLNSLPKLRGVVCNEDDDKNDSVRCRFSSSTAFHNLKFLSITNCGNKVEDEGHINTPMEDVVLFDGKVSFTNLEKLILCDLPKLREIWHHQHPPESFYNLQILEVDNCPSLLNLIPSHLIQRFDNLKKMDVDKCEVLKHVFDLQGLDENIRILPRLESLRLNSLPKLRGVVCNEDEDKNDSVRCLFSSSIPFHNLKFLYIEDCGNEVEDEEHINTPTEDVVLSDGKVSLSSNLEEIVLKSLPKLEEIDFGILPKLKILKVEKLPQLVLSSSMFKNFHNIKELRIIDCGMEDMRGVNTSTNDEVLFNEKAPFLESRASTLNKIMDALRDHNINLIGVWGMAGVGKTTLLKQVAQQAKQQRLFTRQAYVDLSSISGLETLRQKIAEALGLPYWKRDADKLKQLLKEEKILIILDDIWTEVDLEQVGIPSKDGIWTQCKIVLAARDRDLLCKGMGAQICFPVEYLPRGEPWSLFKKTAGDSMEENLELRHIAIQVVEECEGLPIAIVTIAEALKDETMVVWKNALEQLRSCAPTNIRAVDKKVYSCLEWSYTHLKGDGVKPLFLLCEMLGYGDISLDLLLRYGMGLDLFGHIDTLEQARNRLLELVEILKASGLLLDSHEDRNKFDEERASSSLFMDADNKFVRMHNVVREVARAIASKDPHPFVVKEWLETDESKRCAFISLLCKAVHDLPPELVLLQNKNPLWNIPDTFFEWMEKLKVLDLSRMHFTTLPSSLGSLANLRTLRLDGCELGDIALIGKLTKLEVLSLVGSTIPRLPKEMMQLTNLRLLDLDYCKKLEVIPRNILSSLSRLECLSMMSGFTKWAVEGESNACLSELNHLSYLTTLFIEIPDAKLLPKDILFENLTRYGIFIGTRLGLRTKRALKLSKVNRSLYLGDGISKLLERSEALEFWELSGTKYVLYPSDRESFRELKHLKVGDSPEIQYIIDSKNQQFLQHGAFPLLESLILLYLENLEEVWHGPIPIGSFGNLKTLNVDSCPKLKFLLLLSTARGLSQLEEMTIEDCNAMQQIIAYERESEIEEDGHVGTNLQLFPKLRSLKLESLPQLINFSSELETTSSTSLSTNTRSEDSFFSHKVSFPKLEELTLGNLPKLKNIWHHQLPFESFSNLQILKVYECPCLLNLVPAHLIHSFQILKEIDVQDCELLEHVIILQEIDGNVEILSKLETLKLENLPRLRWIEDGNDRMKHISSLMTLMNIQNLQELHITDCSMEDLRKM